MAIIAYYAGKVLWIVVWVLVLIWCIAAAHSDAETPFACPNCGGVFHAKWYRLLGVRRLRLVMHGNIKLKCPRCGKTDLCRWKHGGAE